MHQAMQLPPGRDAPSVLPCGRVLPSAREESPPAVAAATARARRATLDPLARLSPLCMHAHCVAGEPGYALGWDGMR